MTSNNNNTTESGKSSKLNEFMCKMRYFNTLPDVPFDPKFLLYPFDPHRFVRYGNPSLESNYKFQIHTEPDLGIQIDLIDPDFYSMPSEEVVIPQEDAVLLDPSEENGVSDKVIADGKKVRVSVPWLKRTQYISSESNEFTQFQRTNLESKTGWANKYKDQEVGREGQIKLIKDTFEAAKRVPVHPTKPELTPEAILPIYPNLDLWPNVYLQVVFDRDPTPDDKISPTEQEELKNEAILKGFAAAKQSLVAYLVPKKRTHDEIEEEYEWVREYQYDVKSGTEFDDSFVFSFAQEEVLYTKISTRVALSKVKVKEPIAQPSKFSLIRREMTAEEEEQRENQRKDLRPTKEKPEHMYAQDSEEEIKDEDD